MSDREQQLQEAQARLRVRLPGLKKSIGAGDVVRKITEALGMEHCAECEERKKRLNQLLRFDAYLETRRGEHESG